MEVERVEVKEVEEEGTVLSPPSCILTRLLMERSMGEQLE